MIHVEHLFAWKVTSIFFNKIWDCFRGSIKTQEKVFKKICCLKMILLKIIDGALLLEIYKIQTK